MTILKVIAHLKENFKRIFLMYLYYLFVFDMTTIFSNY